MLPLNEEEEEVDSTVDDTYIPMRDLFTNPLVSFAYERGWRQGFAAAGFPGPDVEYNMVKSFFEQGPTSVVVDMSCGSGLMTRRFALDESGYISRLIAFDFSDSMLRETARRYLKSLPSASAEPPVTRVDLVRADVGNMPTRTEGIDAVHAGAAMHCWPDVEGGLKEVS
jgi:ubiquinone/menaquinone biosynthesis C-methylase UbiE